MKCNKCLRTFCTEHENQSDPFEDLDQDQIDKEFNKLVKSLKPGGPINDNFMRIITDPGFARLSVKKPGRK